MSGLLPALGGGGGSGGLSGLVTTHAVQVVAGALSGVLAMSAAIATGVVPTGPSTDGPQTLALVACPGSGSIVAVARPGDEMLVTGRSADGSWWRVYVPGPAAKKDGWVPASSLELLADGSALPIAACIQVAGATGVPGPSPTGVLATVSPTGVATPSAAPSPTTKATAKPIAAPTPTTEGAPSPTTGPTAKPPPTLPPTPTPNVGPVFASGPTSSVPTMFADASGEGDCWGLPRRTTIKVEVADPNGVSAVQLWVKKPGATAFAQLTHNFFDHTSYWSTYIDAYYDHIYAGGTMSFYAVAIDGTGLKTTSKTASVAVRQCDTDATVTWSIDLPQDSEGTYFFQGNCVAGPVPWYFKINDPDGRMSNAVLSLTKTNYYGTTYQTVNLLRGLIYWYGESTTLNGLTTNAWVLTATDVNGGTTVLSGSVKISSVCIK